MGGRSDDWQGFEEVYRETSVPVRRFLRRRLPAQPAEDALSEVHPTAWRRRHEVRRECLPWLYGFARLVAANALRSAGRSHRLRELLPATGEDRPGAAAGDGAMVVVEGPYVDLLPFAFPSGISLDLSLTLKVTSSLRSKASGMLSAAGHDVSPPPSCATPHTGTTWSPSSATSICAATTSGTPR